MGSLGQIAFDAYSESAGGLSLATGDPLPAWADLTERVREAWEDAAEAVAETVLEG